MTVSSRYSYDALDSKGRKVGGELQASSRNEAMAQLKAQGLSPWRIDEEGLSAPTASGADAGHRANKLIELLQTPVIIGKKLSARQQSDTLRQLGGLIKAGLPVDQALGMMIEVTRTRELKTILYDALQAVRQGHSLSEALATYGRDFPKFVISMIHAGEASGDLEQSLTASADVLHQNAETRALIRSSLAYPLFVLCVSLVAVFILLTVVVPRFLDLFIGWGEELPQATRVLVNVHAVLTESGGWMALILGLLVLGIVSWVRVSPSGRTAWGSFVLRIPLIGRAVRDSEGARLTRSLAVMLRGGVPLPEALNVASGVVSNATMSASLRASRDWVQDGASLASVWRRDRTLPPAVAELAAIGETTGDVALALDQAAELLEGETRQRIKYLTNLLEPALLLGMAVIVGFVVTAILLPIISLTNFPI